LLYATPVGSGGTIVVASDIALILGGNAWTPVPDARLFFIDPDAVTWWECETSAGCKPDLPQKLAADLQEPTAAMARMDAAAAAQLGLDAAPTVHVGAGVKSAAGTWTVACLVSMRAIVTRERGLLLRLVVAAVAAAIAVTGVGAAILRQQRKAV